MLSYFTMKLPHYFTIAGAGALLLLMTTAPTTAHAAPKAKKAGMEAKMAEMLQTKENRMMALHELMKTKERKTEIAKVLKADAEFREVYGNATTGGG